MSGKFKYCGDAFVLHINTRKEGQEDKELAIDVKFLILMPHLDVDVFDEELPKLFFKSNGAIRNKMLGPVTFLYEMKGYRIDLLGHVNHDARLKKFSLRPLEDGRYVELTFQASFKPSGNEVALLAEYLQEGTLALALEPSDGELQFEEAA